MKEPLIKKMGHWLLSFQSPLGRGASKNKVGNVAGDNKQLLNFFGHAFQSRFLIVAGLKEALSKQPGCLQAVFGVGYDLAG